MINTDKYEGHSPWYEWMLRGSGEPELCRFADGDVMLSSYWLSCPATKANQKLIADAPKLLAEVKRLREENDFLRSISSRDAIEASVPVNWVLRKLMFDDCIEAGINRRIAYYAAMGYMMMESGRWTPPKQGPYADIFNGDEEE